MSVPIDHIVVDIHEICTTLGPRPALSQEEANTAQWVKSRLHGLGIEVIEQPFYSSGRLIERLGPVGLLTGIGLLAGLGQRRWRHILGMVITAAAAWGARQAQSGQMAFWETIQPQRRAFNIIGRIPPQGPLQNRVVLIAHLDTDLERLSSYAHWRDMLPSPAWGLQRLAPFGAALTFEARWRWLRKLLVGAALAQTALLIADEMGAYVPGANDNASGVALLLALTETLRQSPLQGTEVVIVFTSCDTLQGRGSAELAAQFGDQWHEANWIVVDSIGAGELCWIPGIPDTGIVQTMQRVAAAYPAWGIMARLLTVPDPTTPFTTCQLQAAAIMGYERTASVPVNWRQATDTVEHIAPDTLRKARQFLQAVLKEIDCAGKVEMIPGEMVRERVQ
jgi:hypothetical protein